MTASPEKSGPQKSVIARRYPWLVDIPLVVELFILFVVALGELALNLSAFKALREQALSTNVLAATVGFATAGGCYLVAVGLRHVLDQPHRARGRNPVHFGLAALAGGVLVAVVSVAVVRSVHFAMLADVAGGSGRHVGFWPPFGLQFFLATVGVGVSLAHINPAVRERDRLEAAVEQSAEERYKASVGDQAATNQLANAVAAQRRAYSDVLNDVDINVEEAQKVLLAYYSGLELALGRSRAQLDVPMPTLPDRIADIGTWLNEHPVSQATESPKTKPFVPSPNGPDAAPGAMNGSAHVPTSDHAK